MSRIIWAIIIVLVVIIVGGLRLLRGSFSTGPEGVIEQAEPVDGAPTSSILPTTSPLTGEAPAAPGNVPGTTSTSGSTVQSVTVAEGQTVAVTSAGFVPATITIPAGSSVTFRNDDTLEHQVMSDPHPVHTDYPSLNGPALAAGATRAVTFPTAGTFGYHDHLNPALRGTVVAQRSAQ